MEKFKRYPRAIAAIVSEIRPDKPFTSRAVKNVLNRHGLSPNTAPKHIRKLQELGVIIPDGTVKNVVGHKRSPGRPYTRWRANPEALKALKENIRELRG